MSQKNKYIDMSDDEINQAVTCEFYGCHEWLVDRLGGFYHCGVDGSGYYHQEVKDYCNNPYDALSLIKQERIGMYPSEGPDFMPWFAAKNAISVTDKNPLRAAMIVYLLTQEEPSK